MASAGAAAGEDLDGALLAAAGDLADTWEWAATRGVDHGAVVGALKSLEVDGYLASDALSSEVWQLTAEADGYVERGSPEKQLLAAVARLGTPGGSDEAELKREVGDELLKVGLGKCMKNKWIARDKASGRYSLVRAAGRGAGMRGSPALNGSFALWGAFPPAGGGAGLF